MLKIPVSEKDHIRGPENAPLTLVEYGDYQCPFCAKANPIVLQVMEYFGAKLRYIFRNFPLAQVHPQAEEAAEIAEFAGNHGRFWDMHDLLFENHNRLSTELLIDLTQLLQLPSPQEVLEKNLYLPKIKADFMGGVRSGVNGTPTFFINGMRHNGDFQLETLIAALKQAA